MSACLTPPRKRSKFMSVNYYSESALGDSDVQAATLSDEPVNPETTPGIPFIPSEEFEQPRIEAVILADLNENVPPTRRVKPPAELPAYLAALYEVPLLTAEQERHLFRQFNFLKWKADRIRRSIRGQRPAPRKAAEVSRLLQDAAAVRERIARANLRLVVANARLFTDADHLFEDLVSDGNLSLLQAIEKFDYARGFRFSTYATHAIRRTFYRRITRKQREKTRMTFAGPELLSEVPQPDSDEKTDPGEALLFRRLLKRMASCLSEREIEILRARYSLETDAEAPTLQALARTMGICKERVRQLQNRAVEKLRALADEIRAEFDPDLVRMDDVALQGA